MPEKPGEIAIEESALARMRLDDVGVGDTVTLTLTPVEGVDEVRTFTIVGIMENQSANMKGYSSFSELYMEFPAILIHPTEAELSTGRLVQHKLFSFAPGVMGYQALTYYTRTDAQGAQTYGNLQVFDGNDNPTNWPSDLIAPNPAVLLYTVCIGVLAGTLLLATCVGIAGAMESQLSRRVSEIGMLRAVGATKKQIRRIFGREALLLALIVFGVFARGIFTSGKTTTEHAQRELHTYAEQHETSLADYPDALVQLYARNPDARDFVRDYPKKKDLTPTIDLSNLSGSKTVPLLLQWDERWGYREYNESIIGLAGCGPTCLSMATIYLTGDTTKDPLWMCRFAEQNQFNVPGSGSKWALISEGGRMLGLDVTQIPLDKDRIYRNLDVGNPIIVVVGPGDFTTDGHFLVLTGHSGDKITLNDPNSPTNSAKSWDYDTLAGQIQALWVLRRAG